MAGYNTRRLDFSIYSSNFLNMQIRSIITSLAISLPSILWAETTGDTVGEDSGESGMEELLSARPTARIPSYFLNYKETSTNDFDDVDGGFSYSQLSIDGAICTPIKFNSNHTLIIKARYRNTDLDIDTALGGLDLHDLHDVRVDFRWVYSVAGSKWSWVNVLSPGVATDGGSIGSDDFSLNAVFGVGYQKSEKFRWLGGIAFFANDFETRAFPGIGFTWRPADNAELEFTGIRLRGSWQPSDEWIYRFDARPGGGTWQVEENGEEFNVDLDSYQIGFGVERRLTKKLWLNFTGGITLGNEIEVETSAGQRVFQEDAEAGWFGQLGIRLAIW